MIDKMPLRPGIAAEASASAADRPPEATRPDWKSGLPVLSNELVTLRDLRVSDAPSLFAMLSSQEVHRYMSAPPSDVAGFERFIQWAHGRTAPPGAYMCFAVVPKGYDVAVGIMQVRQIDPAFTMGEWGAALGSQFWGTGLFEAAVDLLFEFVFDTSASTASRRGPPCRTGGRTARPARSAGCPKASPAGRCSAAASTTTS